MMGSKISRANNWWLWGVGFLVILAVVFTSFFFFNNKNLNSQQSSNTWVALQKELRKEKVVKINLTHGTRLGSSSPYLEIVEFLDFKCPYCKKISKVLKNFLEKNSKLVTVHYFNYPLDKACNSVIQRSIHQGACMQATGSICADEQGKYASYSNSIFLSQGGGYQPLLKETNFINQIASKLNLNVNNFRKCFQSSETKAILQKQIQEGITINVKGTPSIYVKTRKMLFKRVSAQYVNEENLYRFLKDSIKK